MLCRKLGARPGLDRCHSLTRLGRRAARAQWPAPEQGAAGNRAGSEDADGPPERGVVAVRQRLPGEGLAADQPGRGEMRGEVGGDGGGEDGVQQRGADRGAELWPTVTVADATPASWGATPKVPVLIAGAIIMPRPIAARMIGPSTPAA